MSSLPPLPSPVDAVVVDPAVLARPARDAPLAGTAAERLVSAARDLAAVLVLAVPAAPGRPAGGRSGPLAAALADRWAVEARSWAAAVAEHADRVAGTGRAFAVLDEDAATVLTDRRPAGGDR